MANNSQYRLWTPIANAFEVYRRRLIAEPTAVYEHIWRIIHIEEAMIVVIGSALAARLYFLWKDDPDHIEDLNDLRSRITGLRIDRDGAVVIASNAQGCWNGSIGAWTDLLTVYGRQDTETSCKFCNALGRYFTEDLANDIAFFDAWQRISPVPEGIFKTRIARLTAINSLRNKLAHVPVSERLLPEVHKGLQVEIIRLLSPDERLLTRNTSDDIVTTKWHDPLYGRICTKHVGVTGSDFFKSNGETPNGIDDEIWFEWDRGDTPLAWNGSPFVCLDGELKAMLLFRVDNLEEDPGQRNLRGEYYRFAAEIEPVQKLDVSKKMIRPWIPVQSVVAHPDEEYPLPKVTPVGVASHEETLHIHEEPVQVLPTGMSDVQLRTKAEILYRLRDYSKAVTIFDELASRGNQSEYNHVTMLHHGEAIWKAVEYADPEHIIPDDEKDSELKRSVEILGNATGHHNPQYAAKAFYQRSKVYRRIWQITADNKYYKLAKEDASEAARLAYEARYISWYERIEQETLAEHQTQPITNSLS